MDTDTPTSAIASPAARRSRSWLPALTGLGMVGLAATSGIMAIANRFVDELSRPHQEFDPAVIETITGDWRMPDALPEPPAALRRALTFCAPKGPRLRGEFWAQPRPAPTVVVCHGYRTPRTHLRPVAALEYAHGFNVLLFDFRGHGESDAVPTSGGLAEVRDLQAALDVARSQPETLPGRIILHGFSMGAAIALLTPPHPDVAAIIADSPYAHLDAILRRLVEYQLLAESTAWRPPLRALARTFPALAWTAVTASRLIFRVRYHAPLVGRPVRAFRGAHARFRRGGVVVNGYQPPVLLIHAAGDVFIPIEHARQIAAAALKASVPIETYFVEANGHCAAYGHDPDGYVSTVMRFLGARVPGVGVAA